MSKPVDIVAAGREAVDRIVCYDALSMQWNGRRDSDIVSELCDKVERLQAELEKERRLHGMARSTISSRIVRDYGSVEPHIVGDIRGESYIGWRDRVDTWLPLSIRWALLRCDQRRAGQS